MTRADLSSPRSTRVGVAIVVGLLHVALVLALIRAFAPEFSARVAEQVMGAFTVTITAPPPKPPPAAAPEQHRQAPEQAGAAAEAGRKAVPEAAIAPAPRIVVASPTPVPTVAGAGRDVTVGARADGTGTGAGGQGTGTGSGAGGTGQGGGGASRAVKIAGDINSTRDYPKATRDQRVGDYVIVALIVGTDGRVKGCSVHRASRDPESDQITCRLATKRFRFRPATDAVGNPVESIYGWQQRWWVDPAQKMQADLEPSPRSGI